MPKDPGGTRIPPSGSEAEVQGPNAQRLVSLRGARRQALIDLACLVPGEDRKTLVDYLAADVAGDGAEVRAAFGLSERKVAELLGIAHPHVELQPGNVIALTADPERLPEGVDPKRATTLLAVYTQKSDGTPAAYRVTTFYRDPPSPEHPQGALHEYLDYIIVNIDSKTSGGLADAIAAGVERLHGASPWVDTALKTAWVGRYRWALDGYDFVSDAEKQAVLGRLRAFLEHFGIEPKDLVFDRGDGTVEPFAWEKLAHSWDVAQLRAPGKLVTLPVLVGYGDVRADSLDVGKAFFLGDWQDPVVGALVLRNWHGVRSRDPDSPSAQQYARYAALRASRAKGTKPAS